MVARAGWSKSLTVDVAACIRAVAALLIVILVGLESSCDHHHPSAITRLCRTL